MKVKVGCDVVEIPRFKKSLRRGGQEFLRKIFLPPELAGAPKAETLAGIFAAKEAVTKALGLKAGKWHKIEVKKSKAGRPEVLFALTLSYEVVSYDLSISHDGDYAMAVVVFLVEDEK